MKYLSAPLVLSCLVMLGRSAGAQEEVSSEPAPEEEVSEAPEPAETQLEPRQEPVEVAVKATTPAPEPPVVPPVPKEQVQHPATLELYGVIMPFLEYVGVSGSTAEGYQPSAGHVGTATLDYSGTEGPPRFRMTSGTSHFGIRGSLKLAEQFTVLGQFENALVVDGDPNPWEQVFPNRDSYLGFKGDWGTVVAGLLTTPYAWSTQSTVNPIKGGYVADYTAIIGTPGFVGIAVNSNPRWVSNPFSNIAFERREVNSVQYWSPEVWGLSLRAGVEANEFRPAGDEFSPETNPYIVSLAAGFDWKGLRLRYAWEWHHDYFGMAYIAQTSAPSLAHQSADDWGNRAVAQYTLTVNPDLKTRIVAIGEHLEYTMSHTRPAPGEGDFVSGIANSYSRPAFYVLLQQTFFQHNIWGAYGRAFDGECSRIPLADGTSAPCTTTDVGAQWMMAGYMYEFTPNAQAYFMAYRLANERSGAYVTTPSLLREGLSPGFDQLGAGLGFRYAFSAGLM